MAMAKATKALTKADFSEYPVLVGTAESVREIAKQSIDELEITPGDLVSIRVPGGGSMQWTLSTAAGETQVDEVVGVIAKLTKSRAYWVEQFGEGEIGAPDCSSDDAIAGRGFFDGSKGKAGLCVNCRFSEWGSGAGNSQACKQSNELYLLAPGVVMPSVLIAPPGSLKAIRQYLVGLFNSRSAPGHVETSFRLERVKNNDGMTSSRIVPTLARHLGDAEIARVAVFLEAWRPLFSSARRIDDDKPTPDVTPF